MKKTILTIATMALLATACNHKAKTDAPQLTSGIDPTYLDTTANPVEDFYRYACGGWMDANPLKPEYSRYGSFDKLAETNQEQLRGLIDSVSAAQNEKGSIADKIATLYNIGMDSVKLNQQGAQPIQQLLKDIAALSTREALAAKVAELHHIGIDPFFGVMNEADPDNSKMQMAWIWQTGLGMGDRDYYLEPNNADKRQQYQQLIAKEMVMAGYDKMSAFAGGGEVLAKMVMGVETRLAKAQYDKLKNRDPHATLHKMSIDELKKIAPAVAFDKYFAEMGLANIKNLNVGQPEYMAEVSKVLANENMESVKAYMAWQVVNSAAAYLSDDFVQANFEFYGKTMSGQEQMRPRWKRVTSTVNGAMSEALGQLYVAKYFPPEAKERMLTLVGNLKEAFAVRIDQANWMDPETKEKAKDKLAAILVKVGYPDKWRDYSKLDISDDSYFANVLRSNRFDVDYMMSKIDKPTDRSEWGMPPQMVNAYYNPTTNEICFPAAILQPPFFNMNADDAANYGAIGVVIGHEMTHGFDDQGHEYDKEGNLNNWWKESDAANFKSNAQVLIDYFNGIKVLDNPETFANGAYCLGENIADNGGLHISYVAMQKALEKKQVNAEPMDGFTPEQRFYLAYAAVWASNIRDEEIVRLTAMDVHSLAKWRVNGTLPHITEFIEAFDVQPSNKMYLEPEKRVTLW